MKSNLRILFLLLIALFSGCEDTIVYNCEDCFSDEPYDCDLMVEVSNSRSIGSTYFVQVFMGKIEDNAIIDERNTSSEFSIRVNLNQEYSVRSEFNDGSVKYTSINSATPRVVYKDDYCESPCYFIKDNTVNMKFKYY